MNYPVNEIFESIQGEASWTGTPSVFVRLQGCPVGCPWCDTKHTWSVRPEALVPVEVMVAKSEDDESHSVMSDEAIERLLSARYRARHVVITGGEPCMHDLGPLTTRLLDSGRTVQIETSGTFPIRADERTFVTLSPKLDMPGGLPLLDSALARADEIKLPVGKAADHDRFRQQVLPLLPPGKTVWLQPLSQNPSATALCIELATAHGHRVSLQTHKFINVR